MPRHKTLSIQEQGGLKPYLKNLGIDYRLVVRMLNNPKMNNTSIAEALNDTYPDREPLRRYAVRHWREVNRKEVEDVQKN